MTITTQTDAGKVVISGQEQHRILKVTGSNTDLTLTRVDLEYGFRSDLSSRGGAAILIDDATVNIYDSRLFRNISNDNKGGAIFIEGGEINIHNSLLEYNTSQSGSIGVVDNWFGGAIYSHEAEVNITETTFQGNSASKGASVYIEGGNLLLERSLVGDIISGIHGEGVVADIINTTFNIATPSAYTDKLLVFGSFSSVTLNHVSANTSLLVQDTILNVSNSWIIDCRTPDSTWVVDTHNAFESNHCNGNSGFTHELLPLNDNGGPTQTRALPINSDLINAGDVNYCASEDQRGEDRIGLCDIGAYEANGFADVSVNFEISDAAPFASNQTIIYTAKIKNNGPGIANAVAVHLDTNNVFIDSIDSPLCNSFPCVINNIQDQQEIIIPVNMTVGSHSLNEFEIILEAGTSTNSNHEDFDEDEPFPVTNNIENEIFQVVAGADMHIDMELLTSPPYFVGQTISYQATLKNLGQQMATGITFDFIPINLSDTSFTGCSSVNGQTCNTLNLLDVESRVVTVDAMITDNQFDATGIVSSALLDINLTNNTDDQQNGGGVNETDISVAMSLVQNGPIYSDQYMQFEIRLKGGAEDASNVKIWSEFPGSITISHSGCPFLPCTIPLLLAEEEMVFYFDFYAPIVDVTAGNTYRHRIFVLPGQQDTDLSNNEIIIEGPLNPVANLAIFADIITQPPYYQNQEVEYQFRVINAGINTANNVNISAGDPNLELMWIQGSQCSTLACQLSELLFTQEEYITAVYRIKQPGAFNLKATVNGDEMDLDTSNNTSSVFANASEIPNDIIFEDSFD